MKRFLLFFLALTLFWIASPSLQAITAVARDFDQLVTRADTVFEGTVTASTPQWIGEGDERHIVTFVTFRVEETYKGPPAPVQTLRFFGGTLDGVAMEVPDMPQFEIGQKAVLFVVGNGKQFCPLVGLAQGRFHVLADEAGGQERIFTDDGSPMTGTAEIGKLDEAGVPRLNRKSGARAQALAVDDFRSEILGKVAALAH